MAQPKSSRLVTEAAADELAKRVGVTPRGAWAASTAYVRGDVVTSAGASYRALADHTSAAGTPPAAGAVWQLLAAKGDPGAASTVPGPAGRGFTPRGAWAASTAYAVDDLVTAGGSTFRVTTAHTSGATAPTLATPGANLVVWAAAGAAGAAGTQLLETTETAYANMTATQRAAAWYAFPSVPVVDPNVAAPVQANLQNGVITDFGVRGSGGTLSADSVGGVGAVRLTAGASPSSDLGTGFLAPIEAGKVWTAKLTARHAVEWSFTSGEPRNVRVDLIWRDSAAGLGNSVGTPVTGTATTTPPAVGQDVTLTTSGTAPAGATRVEVRFRNSTSGPTPAPNGAWSLRQVDVRTS